MTFQENISNNLCDDESIVNYMNLIFSKQIDQLNPTSIKTYNGRLKSMKIEDYYNIDEINKKIDKVKVTSTRKISCNAITNHNSIELEKIYQSAQTSDGLLSNSFYSKGNFVYTNDQKIL